MKRLVTAVLACPLVLTSAASAQDPLACLDPGVADTLLAKPGQGPYKITRDWPTGVPVMTLPEDFEFIGSRTSPYTATVAFATELSASETAARLEDALAKDGWARRDAPAIHQRGFRNPSRGPKPTSITFCSALEGHTDATLTRAADDRTYITLTTQLRGASACPSWDEPGMDLMPAEAMPLLELPEGDYGYASGSWPTAENRVESTAQLQSSRAATELLEFFGRQLAVQNWRREGQWSAGQLHGSAWLSADESVYGFLTVHDEGRERYTLEFRATGFR